MITTRSAPPAWRTPAWLTAVALSACMVGSRVGTYRPAQSARGADCTFTLVDNDGHQLIGELVAAGDTAALLDAGGVLYSIPYRITHKVKCSPSVTFEKVGNTIALSSEASMREFARYRGGVSQEMLTAVLAAYKQTTLRVATGEP